MARGLLGPPISDPEDKSFPPVFPDDGEWAGVNPRPVSPVLVSSIPAGSISNDKLGNNLDPRKIQGFGAKVYRSSTQSISTATDTEVSFDTAAYDRGDFWTTTTKMYAPYDGIYLICGYAEFEANATGNIRKFWLKLNGSTDMAVVSNSPITGSPTNAPVTITYKLDAGDYVELLVRQDSGAGLNVNSGESNNFLSMTFLFTP